MVDNWEVVTLPPDIQVWVETVWFPLVKEYFDRHATSDSAISYLNMDIWIESDGFVMTTPNGLLRCSYEPFTVERKEFLR